MSNLSAFTTNELIKELHLRKRKIATALNNHTDIRFVITQTVAICRRRAVTFPRQIAMTLMKECNHTWDECSSHFHIVDHGAAIYAVKKISALEKSCATFAQQMQTLRKALAEFIQS